MAHACGLSIRFSSATVVYILFAEILARKIKEELCVFGSRETLWLLYIIMRASLYRYFCIALLNDHWLLGRTSFEKCRLEFILMTEELSAGSGTLHLQAEVVVKGASKVGSRRMS